VAGTPTLDAILQVCWSQQRCGGNNDSAELHRRQDRLPQLDLVAKHNDDPVATSDALLTQPVGDTIGALRHLGEGAASLAAVLLHDH
jgi:hypothetical protein